MRLVHPLGASVDGVGVVGTRGSSLARLKSIDLPVAPGFTVATTAWRLGRLRGACGLQPTLARQIDAALAALQLESSHRIDDPRRPLMLSVTPSALDDAGPTPPILDVGLSDATVGGLATRAGAPFAWNAYCDLLNAFCLRVHRLDPARVSAALQAAAPAGKTEVVALKTLLRESGHPFPQRCRDQLAGIVTSLIEAADEPIAVVVQLQTIGAGDERSGVGTVCTREPVTGTVVLSGEFRPGGRRRRGAEPGACALDVDGLGREIPGVAEDLRRALAGIEAIHRDMCEVQFTIERGRLWFDDARPGRRSAEAAVRIAVDLVDAGLIDIGTALQRVPVPALAELQRATGGDLDASLARVLGWASAAGVPVRDRRPADAIVVTLPSDLDTAADLLRATRPGVRLWLELEDGLSGDLRPPPGNWAGVVAPPHLRWAATLLAWRLNRATAGAPAVDPGSAGSAGPPAL